MANRTLNMVEGLLDVLVGISVPHRCFAVIRIDGVALETFGLRYGQPAATGVPSTAGTSDRRTLRDGHSVHVRSDVGSHSQRSAEISLGERS